VYTFYRANLAPLGIGFFSYEGRGVSANAGGGPMIDRPVYDTSTLANKVQEGTLLAAEIAVQIPNEVAGLVLVGRDWLDAEGRARIHGLFTQLCPVIGDEQVQRQCQSSAVDSRTNCRAAGSLAIADDSTLLSEYRGYSI
jgi:hypothetical protein